MPAEPPQRAACPRENVAAARQLAQVHPPEQRRPARTLAERGQQLAEALHRHVPARDLALGVAPPEQPVDRSVTVEGAAPVAQPESAKGRAQGSPLGAVEVEQRIVEVQQDGADAGQRGPTWRGR